MGHLKNRMRWCLKKGTGNKKHRGLRRIKPDKERTRRHIRKAEHNLRVMHLLMTERAQDWAIAAAFYSRYHCLLALLAMHGYESRNQECTFTIIEHLIRQKKFTMDLHSLRLISSQEAEQSLLTLREEFQYGTETEYGTDNLKDMWKDTQEFLEGIKVAIQ